MRRTGGDIVTYTVTVRATDPAGIPQAETANPMNSDTVDVVITVTDVNEPPAVTGDAAVPFLRERRHRHSAVHDLYGGQPGG